MRSLQAMIVYVYLALAALIIGLSVVALIKLDRIAEKAREGSGLGLFIVFEIIEEHGGGISATNRAEGGAEFRIQLAAAPAAILSV